MSRNSGGNPFLQKSPAGKPYDMIASSFISGKPLAYPDYNMIPQIILVVVYTNSRFFLEKLYLFVTEKGK